MRTLLFNSFRIARQLPLEPAASYFKLALPVGWRDYIMLESFHLNDVFKNRSNSRKAYLFGYGCVVFQNFSSEEISVFLEFLQTLAGTLDYSLYARYHESHIVKIYPDNSMSLWKDSDSRYTYSEGAIDLVASVIAKSTALEKIESDLGVLLDEAEGFIGKLQKGRFKTDTGSFAAATARLLRYEYDMTANIRIFDRPDSANYNMEYREIYDSFSDHYELSGRFEVLEKKTGELRNIMKSYSTLSYSRQERRLFLFEAFLLALFPLSYLVENLLASGFFTHILKFMSLNH